MKNKGRVTMEEKTPVIDEKWDYRFMDLAKTVAEWSSCVRNGRHVGALCG